MKENLISSADNCSASLSPFVGAQNPVTQSSTPFVFSSTVDHSQPFGYETSDLKNVYLSRHELQSRIMAPALTQYQYIVNNNNN